ncbi:MAG TPA: DNA methyltransferase [Tepidisphaeraceae bacterium]|nr:DNA methyltransferase [Tepidisphaeraceae bacterium]
MKFKRPPLRIQPTTLWDYPSQDYGEGRQGVAGYKGATPSYVIWNLIQRYTAEKDLVVDPFCGSGTTLDVARDLNRKALGYDVHPTRKDIFRVDARKLPPELTGKVDLVFMDPPYSTHLDYGPDPRDIGKLDAAGGEYYTAMAQVFAETFRILKPGKIMGLYVSDSYVHEKRAFHPLGFELFGRLLKQGFTPVDIVAVTRHNKTLEMGNYRKAAEEQNFFLRGFNYLLIVRKPENEPRRHEGAKKTEGKVSHRSAQMNTDQGRGKTSPSHL